MAFPLSAEWFRPPSQDDGDRTWFKPSVSGGARDANAISDTDQAVVALIRDGNHEAFRALYEESLDLMLRFAYGYVRETQAAQDIVADVFVAVWEHRAEWNPARGVRAYLLAAVRNRAMDRSRHNQVIAKIHASTSADDVAQASQGVGPPLPDIALELEERRARLRQAIGMLSPERRRALMLRWQDGLSPTEIAAAMGISRAAVDQLVSRGIRTLRTVLRD